RCRAGRRKATPCPRPCRRPASSSWARPSATPSCRPPAWSMTISWAAIAIASSPSRRPARSRLEHRRQRLTRGPALDHRYDLELDALLPVGDPALEQRDVVGLHELDAAAEIGADIARHEGQPLRQAAAGIAQLAIDRLAVLIAELFDHHEEHVPLPASPLI